jgi:hypothetical protein
MSNLLKSSPTESAALGLKIGRFVDDEIKDVQLLKKELDASDYDVVKFNLLANNPEIYVNFDALKYPYYSLGAVMQYRINFKRLAPKPMYHEDAEMIEYDTSLKETLYQMAYDTFFGASGSFFQNPALTNLVEKSAQAAMLAEYVCSFNPLSRENHFTYLLKYQNEFVGFISFYFKGESGFTEFAGVRTSKMPGFYIDLVRFIQNHCIENNIRWGHASAQLQNTVVHKVYQKEDMIPYQSYLNVHMNLL